jgi:hypothetical protein
MIPMRKRTINWLLSAFMSLMLLLAFCPMSTAFADKPNTVFVPIDETFTDSSDCGFDIVTHFEGRIKFTLNPDNPDLLQSQALHLHFTLTNPTTGKSVTFPASEKLELQLVDEGTSLLAVFTGLSIQVTVPGQGRIFTQTGRIVFEFPCQDIFQCVPTSVVFFAGQHDEDFSPVCAFLAE